MLSLANVRYILSRDRLTDPEFTDLKLHAPDRPWNSMDRMEKLRSRLSENFSGRKIYVYENTKVLDRYFFVSGTTILDDERTVFNEIAKSPVSLLRRQIFMSKSDGAPFRDRLLGPFDQGGEIRIIQDARNGGDRVELEITPAPKQRLLFASVSYSPFWKCKADNQPVPLLPGNYAFWAIPVPAGAKNISCGYRPAYALGGD